MRDTRRKTPLACPDAQLHGSLSLMRVVQSRSFLGLVGLGSTFLVACGGDAAPPEAMYDHDDSASALEMSMKCSPALQNVFKVGGAGVGLTTTDAASNVAVRIQDATQIPPVKDNTNDWTIAITDAAGAPLPNAKLGWACAWMAVHGHGSNPQAIEDMGGGMFKLTSLNLSMYGEWAERLWVDPTGAGPQYLPQNGTRVGAGLECMPTNGAAAQYNIEINFCVPDTRGGAGS
jgi:hypothetical protein